MTISEPTMAPKLLPRHLPLALSLSPSTRVDASANTKKSPKCEIAITRY
jgi:hypothetical protein